MRARPEPTQFEHLSDASFLGKLLVLPANVRLDLKVIALYKHSSLFGLVFCNKEKKFYNIDSRAKTTTTENVDERRQDDDDDDASGRKDERRDGGNDDQSSEGDKTAASFSTVDTAEHHPSGRGNWSDESTYLSLDPVGEPVLKPDPKPVLKGSKPVEKVAQKSAQKGCKKLEQKSGQKHVQGPML